MVLSPVEPALAAAAPRRRKRFDRVRWIAKPAVFVACLVPFAWLVWRGLDGKLGVNPIEAFIRGLGDWALTFLLITLSISPAKRLFGWSTLMRFRRMLGLFAFFYAAVHVSSYIGIDQFFAWQEIWADIVKRRFITFGMLALVLLIPLAITSTKGWIKRLGGNRWQQLHRLVYPAATIAVVHYFMMVKADIRQPLLYAGVLAVLLGYRLATRPKRAAACRPAIG